MALRETKLRSPRPSPHESVEAMFVRDEAQQRTGKCKTEQRSFQGVKAVNSLEREDRARQQSEASSLFARLRKVGVLLVKLRWCFGFSTLHRCFKRMPFLLLLQQIYGSIHPQVSLHKEREFGSSEDSWEGRNGSVAPTSNQWIASLIQCILQ